MRLSDTEDVWRNPFDAASRGTNRFRSATLSKSGTSVSPKLEFPRFDGYKIQDWLCHVEQYFEMANTPEKYKVWLVSIHLDDSAAAWHRSLVNSDFARCGGNDWAWYRILLQEQFDDSIAKLHQLQESAGIVDYHEKFQLISTRVKLPESVLVRVFLSGLNTDTQLYVSMLQPGTVRQCLVIGRLYETVHPRTHVSSDKEALTPKMVITDNPKASETESETELLKLQEPDTIVDYPYNFELLRTREPLSQASLITETENLLGNEELMKIKENSVNVLAHSPTQSLPVWSNFEINNNEETYENLEETMIVWSDSKFHSGPTGLVSSTNDNEVCQQVQKETPKEVIVPPQKVLYTVENYSLLAKQTGREVEPDQDLKETAIHKDHTPHYRVDFVQISVNAVTERYGYDLKSADNMWVANAEVLVHPYSHLKHKWKSKETSIPSRFQEGNELALENMTEETRFSCFVGSEAAGSVEMVSYQMDVSVLQTAEEFREMLQSPFFACSVADDILVRPLKDYIMSSCKEKGTLISLESMLLEVAKVHLHRFSEREISDCIQHFLHKEPVIWIDYETQFQRTLLPQISASNVSIYSEKLVSELFTTNERLQEEGIGIMMQMVESDKEQRKIYEANIQFRTSPRVHLIWDPGGVYFRDFVITEAVVDQHRTA